MRLVLEVLPERYGICRLGSDQAIPAWAIQGDFYSIAKTAEELSIVCAMRNIPQDVRCESDWQAFKIQGILDFSLVGVLSEITTSLANAGLGIFAISTYNTDYILVKEKDFVCAVNALQSAGHEITYHENK